MAARTNTEPLVVCIAYPKAFEVRPDAQLQMDIDRLRAIDPRIEVLSERYADPPALRRARGTPPYDGLREQAPALTPEQRDAFARAEVIITMDLPFDMDRLAPRLRWVQCLGAGVGQLQSAGLEKRDVLLTSGAGISSGPIAEFVLGRILMFWKQFPVLDSLQRGHEWKPTYGRKLEGCTVGVIGLGAIGRAVAARARAFGMTVLASRRRYQPGMTAEHVDRLYGHDQLRELVAHSDAIVVCAPETEETFHLINEQTLAAAKKGAFLCNVARGSLVDEAALVAALASGQLAGAALDVFAAEPLGKESPLWDIPNLYISPHSAASADGYFESLWELFRRNMRAYLDGRPLENVVPSSFAPPRAGH
jgi:phosphoglycerate dehydrogenase-like enzyme